MDSLKRFLVFIIFNLLILAHIINAYPDWRPAGPNDKRSPCPGLNSLANHGFLPRDGKNISALTLATAVTKIYRFDDALSTSQSNGVVAVLGTDGKMYVLNTCPKHNFIEHDASLIRNDLNDGNIIPVNQTLVNDFFSFSVGKITPKSITQAETLRTLKCFKYNPNCTAGRPETQRAKLVESSNFLSVFGWDTHLEVDLKIAEPFFRYERLVDGFKPPSKNISATDLQKIQAFDLFPYSWLVSNDPGFNVNQILNP
ncbi:hypothetical protein G9A89_014318 [Geosiphon pyriformis]|nr:hypothetical protein G9A89_014318 [Geosiphon pyriformis]